MPGYCREQAYSEPIWECAPELGQPGMLLSPSQQAAMHAQQLAGNAALGEVRPVGPSGITAMGAFVQTGDLETDAQAARGEVAAMRRAAQAAQAAYEAGDQAAFERASGAALMHADRVEGVLNQGREPGLDPLAQMSLAELRAEYSDAEAAVLQALQSDQGPAGPTMGPERLSGAIQRQSRVLADGIADRSAREAAGDQAVRPLRADGSLPSAGPSTERNGSPTRVDAPDAVRPEGVEGSVPWATTATAGPRGVNITGGGIRRTESRDGSGHELRRMAGLRVGTNGDVVVGGGSEGAHTGPGGESAMAGNASVGMEGGELVGRVGVGRRQGSEDGPGTNTRAGVVVDSDGRVGAGFERSQRDEEGQNTSFVGGSASVRVGDHGVDAASGSAFLGVGANRVTVGSGFEDRFSPPREISPGRWRVAYRRTGSGSVGGSRRGSGAIAGADHLRRGASGGVTGGIDITTGGSRIFTDHAAAMRFYESGQMPETRGVEDATELQQMPPGQVRSSTSDVRVGANGSGTYGVFTASAQAGGFVRVQTVVEGEGEGVVRVTQRNVSGTSGEAQAGVLGLTAGVQASSSEGESITYRLDLNSEAGREALQRIRTGRDPGSAAQVLSSTVTDNSASGTGVNVAGMRLREEGQEADSTTVDEQGRETDRSSGGRRRSVDVPYAWLRGGSVQNGITFQDTDDQMGGACVSSAIDLDSLHETGEALRAATGTHNDHRTRRLSGLTEDSWSLQTLYTAEDVERFGQMLSNGQVGPHAGGTLDDAPREALVRAWRRAGDDVNAQREVLQRFARDGGLDAQRVMRSAIGSGETHLQLEGDRYLTGATHHVWTGQQIARLEAQLEDGPASPVLRRRIRQLMVAERSRAAHIRDPRSYPALNTELRSEEVNRSEAHVARLNQLLQGSGGRTQQAAPAQALPEGQRAPSAQDTAELERVMRRMEGAWELMEQLRTGAQRHADVHGGMGSGGYHARDGVSGSAYESADGFLMGAQASRAAGIDHQQRFADRDTATHQGTWGAISDARRAANKFREAGRKYGQASSAFQSIFRQNQNRVARNGVWDGYTPEEREAAGGLPY